MFKFKLVSAAFLSLVLVGCSASESDKERLENILLEEMTAKEVLEREISQENLQLTESIEDLVGIKGNVNLEESLEYKLFEENIYKLKSKSSIEVLDFDKKNQTVTVNVSYVDVGETLSNTLKDDVERAFVSNYKGETMTKEFYDSLFNSMNEKLDLLLESDSLKLKTKEVIASTNGDFDLEENIGVLTLGLSSEISSLIEHFEKLSVEKEFLEIQENFNLIADLYDKSLSLEKNHINIENKVNFKVDLKSKEKLEDVYYLSLKDSELTISKNHQGNEIFYKKPL